MQWILHNLQLKTKSFIRRLTYSLLLIVQHVQYEIDITTLLKSSLASVSSEHLTV